MDYKTTIIGRRHEKDLIREYYDSPKAELVAVYGPKVLFPYHYGQTDVSVVPSQLQSDGIDVRIRHYE